VVFRPAKLTPESLEAGYWRAYSEFYKWGSIWNGSATKFGLKGRLRHLAYAGGWKKFEPLWDWVIRAKRVTALLPMLETVLTGFGSHPSQATVNTKIPSTIDIPTHPNGEGKLAAAFETQSRELPVLLPT
jgi:hypothetical protein